nr:zinc finger, BED-type [Tanacetum cinerariifolium]
MKTRIRTHNPWKAVFCVTLPFFRLREKRKASGEGMFDANEDEMIFNQGKTTGEKCDDKNKIGRRSVTKAMEVARKTKVEDIWGRQGYGYSQLPARENSGGIMLIQDTRVFMCKEAVGKERLIVVFMWQRGRVRSNDDKLNS